MGGSERRRAGSEGKEAVDDWAQAGSQPNFRTPTTLEIPPDILF